MPDKVKGSFILYKIVLKSLFLPKAIAKEKKKATPFLGFQIAIKIH